MNEHSENAAERGEGPVQDEHRKGPEIDLGRRRFAWLTLGTASTATLMSKSALAGGMHNCGSKITSGMSSSITRAANFKCWGLSWTYWKKHTDNWPSGIKHWHKFKTVCPMAPAFRGKLEKVLNRRGGPVVPSEWNAFWNDLPRRTQRDYRNTLKNCGRAVVAGILNAEHFGERYPQSVGEIQWNFQQAWQVPVAPVTPEECMQQVEYCRSLLDSVKSQVERYIA